MPIQIAENADLRTFHTLPVTRNEIIIIISELEDKSCHSATMPNRILELIAGPLAFNENNKSFH